jgi:hypothetical protein
MSKQFFIKPVKEYLDTLKLIDKINSDQWVDKSTVLVVCSPEYSSMLAQIINHKLSYRNAHVPFDMEFLEMPYPGQQLYSEDRYISDLEAFGHKHINTKTKLLFIDSGVLRGRNFTILDNIMEEFLAPGQRKYACLYKQEDSKFEPDYYVEEFSFFDDGGLTFWWEDNNNPYWRW